MTAKKSPRWQVLRESVVEKATGLKNVIRVISATDSLMILLLLANFLLCAVGFVYVHYFGFDVITSITFFSDDGWCRVPQESVANHCFGDYALTVKAAASINPWTTNFGFPWNYPAGALLPSAFFGALGSFVGDYKVGLFGFLTVGVIALSAPAIWASRGKSALTKVVVISTLSLTSIPALMVLDRGNSVMLVVPALLVFLISLSREKYVLVFVAILFAALIKPQFIVLALIFLLTKRYRVFFITLISAALLNVAAFLVWPANFPSNVLQSVKNTLAYGGENSLSEGFPSNVSFAKAIYWIEFGIRKAIGRSPESSWTDTHQLLASTIFVSIVLVALAISGKHLTVELRGSILLVIASLAVPVSYAYYLVFSLPIGAIVLRDPLTKVDGLRSGAGILDRNGRRRSWSSFVMGASLLIALVVSISRILPPLTDNNHPGILVGSGELAAVAWVFFIITVCITGISRRLNIGRFGKNNHSHYLRH